MFVSTQRFPSAGTKPLVKNGRQMDRAKYWKYSERFLMKYLFLNEKKKFVMLKGGGGGVFHTFRVVHTVKELDSHAKQRQKESHFRTVFSIMALADVNDGGRWTFLLEECARAHINQCSVDLCYPVRFCYLPLKQWVVHLHLCI